MIQSVSKTYQAHTSTDDSLIVTPNILCCWLLCLAPLATNSINTYLLTYLLTYLQHHNNSAAQLESAAAPGALNTLALFKRHVVHGLQAELTKTHGIGSRRLENSCYLITSESTRMHADVKHSCWDRFTSTKHIRKL